MSILSHYATAAEIFRGCVFAEGFDSAADVVRNRGTITGTPTIKRGVTLNGTTDYVYYANDMDRWGSTLVSVVIEFYPDFAATENTERYLYCAGNASNVYAARKTDNASNNTLWIRIASNITNIAYATYSPYWYVGKRNVLVISCQSGSSNIYLNGVQIGTSAGAFTAQYLNDLWIGTNDSCNRFFDGRITSFKIFRGIKLTAQEASDYWTGKTYCYMDDAVLHLPMTAKYHDPANTRTLDVARGNHATWTAGATAPTKLARRGYSFSRTSSQYLNVPISHPRYNYTDPLTCFFSVRQDLITNNTYTIYSNSSAASANPRFQIYARNNIINVYIRNDAAAAVLSIGTTGYIGKGQIVTFGFTCSGNTGSGYLNGKPDPSNFNPATAGTVTFDNTKIGCLGGAALSDYFDGVVYNLFTFSKQLTPLQIADLHIKSLREINNV